MERTDAMVAANPSTRQTLHLQAYKLRHQGDSYLYSKSPTRCRR